jgi:hypothetical protein
VVGRLPNLEYEKDRREMAYSDLLWVDISFAQSQNVLVQSLA